MSVLLVADVQPKLQVARKVHLHGNLAEIAAAKRGVGAGEPRRVEGVEGLRDCTFTRSRMGTSLKSERSQLVYAGPRRESVRGALPNVSAGRGESACVDVTIQAIEQAALRAQPIVPRWSGPTAMAKWR